VRKETIFLRIVDVKVIGEIESGFFVVDFNFVLRELTVSNL
jgi:hypothetical protein